MPMTSAEPPREPDSIPFPAPKDPAGLLPVPAKVVAREAAATRRAYRADFSGFAAWYTACGTASIARRARVQRLVDPAGRWCRVVSDWYGGGRQELNILTGTAVWDHSGRRVPVRWVLVRDVAGEHDLQAFLCTDLKADALDILHWFVRRWALEIRFEEVRCHLGVETQRQWSDTAIARTTPALLALFSLITLWAHDLVGQGRLAAWFAVWYPKQRLTFSDALGAVRRQLWADGLFRLQAEAGTW